MQFDGRGTPEHMDKEQLKQLLSRGWMTHDGMWFAQVLRHAGIETANKLNLAAIRDMAPVEAKRMRRALGIDPTNAELLEKFYVEALNLLIGDFMSFEWEWGKDSFKIRMARCFAHEGMEMLGCADRYECGIFERIVAWLDSMGITNRVEPDDNLCSMHHQGRCEKEVFFEFPPAADRGA